MSGRISVLVTKEEIRPERLEGTTTVVVDVFMATTTLLTILGHGARRVFPVGDLEEAAARTREIDPERLLRGGEQMARRVEGFDCGPYPEEFPAAVVEGRDVVYVSTNGTAAIARARPASRLLIASVRNAPAVAAHLERTRPEKIYIACAGSLGRLALDDLAGAACILSHMEREGWSGNDGTQLAWDLADLYDGRIPDLLRRSRAGRWFFENGETDSFDFVADVGATNLVAEVREGQLVRVDSSEVGTSRAGSAEEARA
ncbi:MAG: 2-phosphosulfolactate phosphatase [Gemmatimonadota bacterium]